MSSEEDASSLLQGKKNSRESEYYKSDGNESQSPQRGSRRLNPIEDGRMMDTKLPSLTLNAVELMHDAEDNNTVTFQLWEQPTVQILELQETNTIPRITISDGNHFYRGLYATLSEELHPSISINSIVKVRSFVNFSYENADRGFEISGLEFISHSTHRFGDPVDILCLSNKDDSTESNVNTATNDITTLDAMDSDILDSLLTEANAEDGNRFYAENNGKS